MHTRPCPGCGAPVEFDATFCTACGAVVTPVSGIHVGRVAGPGAQNVLVVEDFHQVSRSHALVTVDAGPRLAIRDLGSRNGTFVNGKAVGPTPVPFELTDEIRLGSYVLNTSELYRPIQALLGPQVALPPPPPSRELAAPQLRYADPPASGEPAGFWRRFAAALIDGLVVSVVTGPVAGLSVLSVLSGNFGGVILACLAAGVLGWLYYALQECSRHRATLGKRALGIVVTDLYGGQLTFGRATGRYFAKSLSAMILFIGFLMAAFTERKQALHDLAAGTLVSVRAGSAAWALLVALALAGAPVPCLAQGVPSFDARDETVLLGPGRDATVADSAGGRSTGSMLGTGTLPAGTARAFLVDGEAAAMTDGFVRARVAQVSRGAASLLFRAEFEGGNPARLRGYVLTLGNGAFRWGRFEEGEERGSGEKVAIKDLQKRGSVEVALWAVGPHVVAQAFDAETLAPLATLAFTDPRFPAGRVGFRAVAGAAGSPVLTLLAVRRAGQPLAGREHPVGATRLATIRAGDLAALDPALARKLTVLGPAPGAPDRRHVRTDPASLERVVRAGVDVQGVTADEPFALLDAAYRARRGRPPEATATGFRVDRSYKDPDMVRELLQAYAARFPKLSRVVELGRSSRGRPLLALKISDHADRDEDEPAVLLVGATHGGELLSTEFVMDAVQYLLERYGTDPAVRRWVDRFEIWCVPQANPDGTWAYLDFSRQMDRKNARDTNENGRLDATDGVDLNRNYPFRWGQGGPTASRAEPGSPYYRGPEPASEAETQAIMRLGEAERFTAALSFHTQANSILVPYTIAGVRNPEPNEAWTVADEIEKTLPIQSNGRRLKVRRNIYPVDGTDQDWMRAALGTVAYIIEGPYECPLDEKIRLASVESIRPVWTGLLDRYLSGPTVFGRVLDDRGQPVAAEVVVAGAALREHERWTSRCKDGRFDRFLDRPGRVTLEVRQGGRVLASRTVDVPKGPPVRVDLRVPSQGLEAVRCPEGALASKGCTRSAGEGRCVQPGLPK